MVSLVSLSVCVVSLVSLSSLSDLTVYPGSLQVRPGNTPPPSPSPTAAREKRLGSKNSMWGAVNNLQENKRDLEEKHT